MSSNGKYWAWLAAGALVAWVVVSRRRGQVGQIGESIDDTLDETLDDSFPASDPPSWSAGSTAVPSASR
jgi:hypothetical protein